MNEQGTFTAPFDADTTFRRAQLNFFPTDPTHPCRTRVETYNSGGGLGDSFYASVAALVGCNARIIVQNENQVPPNPIRILSFQPIQ